MLPRHPFMLLATLLVACASGQPPPDPDAPYRPSAVRPVSSTTNPGSDELQQAQGAVQADLIQTMLDQKQYYAALAHVHAAILENGSTPQLKYFEAEARRELRQYAQADALYRSLLRGPQEAQAYHGLGLLAAARADYTGAVQHLRLAAGRRPTDARIRNDLGYALMVAGRYAEAQPELATAVELETNGTQARNNLLLLYIVTGDETRLKAVAAQSGVSGDTLAQLRRQAQSLKIRSTKK